MTSQEVFSVHFAEGSPEKHMFEAQSARDWETFLLHRAKELVPGMDLALRIHFNICYILNPSVYGVTPQSGL